MVRMQVTRWSPDTCRCVLEYEWDADLPAGSRVLRLKNVVDRCPEHSGVIDAELWPTVLDENQRKNMALNDIGEFLLGEDYKLGELDKSYVDRSYFSGSDESRILHIITKGLNSEQKAQIQVRANLRFGSEKVVIE